MVTGRPPFMHSNQNKLGNLIKQGVVIFPHPERHGIPMSDELKDIISKLLDKNPATRLGSKNDADDIVNHPWFAKGIDFDRLLKRELDAPFKPDIEQMNKIKGKRSSVAEEAKENQDEELMSLQASEKQDEISAEN
jgi:serum/glucocorticoid-regulated kinase 2